MAQQASRQRSLSAPQTTSKQEISLVRDRPKQELARLPATFLQSLSKRPESIWGFDRTQELAARNRGEEPTSRQYATQEVLELEPTRGVELAE